MRLEVDPAALPPLARRARADADDDTRTAAPTAPAVPSPFIEALVSGIEDAGPRELDRRLCRAAALEQGLLARIGPLLLAFADARGHVQLGFRSLDAYAREHLGISPRKAVLSPGSEPFHTAWIERASGVTVRRLEHDVEHALASGSFDPALLPELPEGVPIGAEPMASGETDVWVANVPADVARLFRAASARWRAASAQGPLPLRRSRAAAVRLDT
jgi:hypothetical protein